MRRGTDINFAIPDKINLADYYLYDNITQGRGKKIAIYYKHETYTFDDLAMLTNKIGNVLRELNVLMEDRVLLILQDSPEWIASWMATMKIGGVATHAYTYLQPSEYEYFLNYVRPKVVVADISTIDKIREAAIHSNFPKAIMIAGEKPPRLQKGEYSLEEMVRSAKSNLDVEATSKNDTALWNFSGGTTGKPKGVPHMHHDGVIGFESFQYITKYTPDDIVLRVPKLFFHYSRDLGMNWALRAGAAVALFPQRTTADLLFEMIEQYKPTVLLNVPTMMRSMLQSPKAKNADLSSLRLCLASGEPLSAQLYEEFTQTFGVEVLNVIGSAETLLGYFMDRPGEVIAGSSGKVTPLVEIKLVDAQGNEVPEGESGILWVRSDASGWMYHMEHEKTKQTFMGNDWINTNDLFKEDENGYWWYLGRADDLIKVSGVYVAPLEIEKCLEKHKAVKEVAVIGVEDADGLTKTKAFITLKEGFQASEELAQNLKDFVRQNLAPFKVPRLIEFMPELPKTGYGKIDRQPLIQKSSRRK